MIDKASVAIEARKCLRASHVGALATTSLRLASHPYASVVPYITDHQANPIVLISRLAEHTKNIGADDRVSLLLYEPGSDVQTTGRVTIVGHCREAGNSEALTNRYLRHFPDAARLLELDFAFFTIAASAIRYIGGFGAIHWLDGDAMVPPASSIADIEASAIDHMNRDHQSALMHYCERLHHVTPSVVRMVGLDCDGTCLRADGRLLRVAFPQPVFDAQAVRLALAGLTKDSGP